MSTSLLSTSLRDGLLNLYPRREKVYFRDLRTQHSTHQWTTLDFRVPDDECGIDVIIVSLLFFSLLIAWYREMRKCLMGIGTRETRHYLTEGGSQHIVMAQRSIAITTVVVLEAPSTQETHSRLRYWVDGSRFPFVLCLQSCRASCRGRIVSLFAV